MLEPQRLLTRLNAVTIDWQNHIRQTGDILTAVDIAASLAGLRKGPYLLVRYLWCQDKTVEKELTILLLAEAIQLAHEQNWFCKSNLSRLTSLVRLAIHEMEKTFLCKPCKGTGVKINQPCEDCNGSGQKRRTHASNARFCGVNPANWKRCWEMKYHTIYLKVLEWNEEGINHMLDRLTNLQ